MWNGFGIAIRLDGRRSSRDGSLTSVLDRRSSMLACRRRRSRRPRASRAAEREQSTPSASTRRRAIWPRSATSAAAPAAAGLRRRAARPCQVAGEQMCGSARILGRVGRRLFREVGREALVEGHDRDVDTSRAAPRRSAPSRAPAPRARRAASTAGPTTTRSACCSPTRAASRASPSPLPARSTTQSGRAIVPVGSETATPVRARPKSSASTFT